MLMEDLVDQARTFILPGFTTLDEVVEQLEELIDDEDDSEQEEGATATTSDARAVAHRIWTDRLAEQSTWPVVTDADRVAQAFDDMERSGIVARMNFTCCQTCGFAEIDDEVMQRPTGSPPAKGFVFFHEQDAERLAQEPATLFLSYGAFSPDQPPQEAASVAIGTDVVRLLEAHDLPVEWDGTLAQRIRVPGLRWRKLLPQ